jgi:hypothetical protein
VTLLAIALTSVEPIWVGVTGMRRKRIASAVLMEGSGRSPEDASTRPSGCVARFSRARPTDSAMPAKSWSGPARKSR